MRKSLIVCLCIYICVSGCTIDEAQKSGYACSPTLTPESSVMIGDIRCFSDRMEGECIDDEGECIKTGECRSCRAEYRECRRYQNDFDRLVENSESPDRKYVTHVNGDEDLSPYSSLFAGGNLNRCPEKAPYCVWKDRGDELEFGCIECSKSICGTECVDLDVTAKHCGECGHACADGAACVDGACVCGEGEIVCDGKCVNPLSDMNYCGAHDSCEGDEAGTACLSYQACKDGMCLNSGIEGEVTCGRGQHPYYTAFGGACEDDSIDNCGRHENSCVVPGWKDGACEAGKCMASDCMPGFHLTDGQCIPDTAQCCGSTCEKCGAGLMCSDGLCTGSCGPGLSECSTGGEIYCANLNEFKTDCGSCGRVCTAGDVPNSESVKCSDAACVPEKCARGYILNDGQCVPEDADNCGAVGQKCADIHTGWKNGVCSGGKCIPSECASNFRLREGRCEIDTGDCCGNDCIKCGPLLLCTDGLCQSQCVDQSICEGENGVKYCSDLNTPKDCGGCGNRCETEKIPGSMSVICEKKKCKAGACVPGYHLYNDTCEADSVKNCGYHDVRCDVANAVNSCVAGRCRFKCETGYHESGEQCAMDSVTDCGLAGLNCTTMIGWENGRCEGGKCVIEKCRSGYHIDRKNQICTADSDICCGESCISCKDQKKVCSNSICELKCDSELTLCEVNGVSNCVDLKVDIQHCGSCGNRCTPAKPVDKMTCSGGKCTAAACSAGYHLFDEKCENDDVSNCGSHGKICNAANAVNSCVSGKCSFNCKTGFHQEGGQCEADSAESCGTAKKDCTKTTGWEQGLCDQGKCVIEKCGAGYHKYNNDCEKDDIKNCGASGKKCASVDHADVYCSGGNCQFNCHKGFHTYNGRCEADSNDNCGYPGVKCTVNDVHYSTQVKCENKTCVAAHCYGGFEVVDGKCKALEHICMGGLEFCDMSGEAYCCPPDITCDDKYLYQCHKKELIY